MAELSPRQYEHLLKEDLTCWKCARGMKNIPVLKTHLQEEWDTVAAKEKAKLGRESGQGTKKRKQPEGTDDTESNAESEENMPSRKRQEVESSQTPDLDI